MSIKWTGPQLHELCRNEKKYDEIEALLQQGDSKSNQKVLKQRHSVYQHAPIHTAVSAGHANIVRLLIKYGADVNYRTGQTGKYTPLHVAAVCGSGAVECVKVLLEQDEVCINARDNYGNTPYQSAVNYTDKRLEVPRLLKSAEIIKAAKTNQDDLNKLLEEGHKNSHITESCYSKALLAATNNNHPQAIATIISSVAQKCPKMALELHYCVELGFNLIFVDVTALLLVTWLSRWDMVQELGYLLGIIDVYIPSNSDNLLAQLSKANERKIQSIRNSIRMKKCTDFAPAINLAIACKHTNAARMILCHGSMNDRHYEVGWKGLGLTSLTASVLKNMCHTSMHEPETNWQNITRIDLRRNNLQSLPGIILQFPLLNTLLLDHNKLKALPDVKWWSSALCHLFLSYNELTDLPASISTSQIRNLYLNHNSFEGDLPSCVCGLEMLEILDISENPRLDGLPWEMGMLAKLRTFKCDKNKILYPLDWRDHFTSPESLVTWMRSHHLSTKPYTTVKLLVAGWQDKGKTTLVHRLRGDLKYDERSITIGVAVSKIDIEKKKMFFPIPGSKITFQVWDFAGQEDFYVMHTCFLSTVGLFILVWNLMDGEKGIKELEPWLENIESGAGSHTTVIVVGTHLDIVNQAHGKQKGKVYADRMNRLVWEMAKQRSIVHVHISHVAEVSCGLNDSQGLKELSDQIYAEAKNIVRFKGEAATDVRVLDEPVPLTFHILVRKIEEKRSNLQKEKQLPILHQNQLWSEVQKVLGGGTKNKKISQKEFSEAVEFLEERGVVLHFNDPNHDLRELYFIDPRWLFDLMACVITNKGDGRTENGILGKVELFLEDDAEMFSDKSKDQCIRLLSRFHIIHILDDDHLLVPSRLTDNRPEVSTDNSLAFVPLKRVFNMQYLPHGFFSRLIARLLHFVESMIVEALNVDERLPKLAVPSANGSQPRQIDGNKGNRCINAKVPASPPVETTTKSSFKLMELKEKNLLHWWRNGVHLCLQDYELFFLVTQSNHVDGTCAIEISVSPEDRGKRLLISIVEQVESMITEWFHGLRYGKISQSIPCMTCEERNLEDPYAFTLEHCIQVSGSDDFLVCPRHEDVPVRLCAIAPDVTLHDVHPDYVFEHHELHYDEKNAIKEGNFGKVYHAVLSRAGDQSVVALKKYKGDNLASFRELRKELNVLRCVVHPNLVRMLGVSIRPPCMAMELAEYGSLYDIIFVQPPIEIARLVVVAIAKEVIDALSFLHMHKIIHRDLKPANVLIFSLKEDAHIHVKITDFGTANFAGPWGLRAPVVRAHVRAPEILEFALKEDYGVQVDVYSFGILLYGLLSRKKAFEESSSNEVKRLVLQHERPPWRSAKGSIHGLVNLTRLMCVSWSQSPGKRPTARQAQIQLGNPGFQALMAKLVFPSTVTVLFIHLMPNKRDLWVVHQNDTSISLSALSDFKSKPKLSFRIGDTEDIKVEGSCTHNDVVLLFIREKPSEKTWVYAYSMTEFTRLSRRCCHLYPSSVSSTAASSVHVFLATNTGCFFLKRNLQTDDVIFVEQLIPEPVSSVLVRDDVLWMASTKYVFVYAFPTVDKAQCEHVHGLDHEARFDATGQHTGHDSSKGDGKKEENGMACCDFRSLPAAQHTGDLCDEKEEKRIIEEEAGMKKQSKQVEGDDLARPRSELFRAESCEGTFPKTANPLQISENLSKDILTAHSLPSALQKGHERTDYDQGYLAKTANMRPSRKIATHVATLTLSQVDNSVWGMKGFTLLQWNEQNVQPLQLDLSSVFASVNSEFGPSMLGHVTCVAPARDTVWLGTSAGVILIVHSDSGHLITWFRPYSGAISTLILCLNTSPESVISCGKILRRGLSTNDDVIRPLSIDKSEMLNIGDKSSNKKPSKRGSVKRPSVGARESEWSEVESSEVGDVLLMWHAMTARAWERIEATRDPRNWIGSMENN